MKKEPDQVDSLCVVGVARIKLTQQRFRKGAVYVVAGLRAGSREYIDSRYYREEAGVLLPTKSGFRLFEGELPALRELLVCPAEKVSPTVLGKRRDEELWARFVDDQYGAAVDFRYWKQSKRYQGWTRRGLRIRDKDWRGFAEGLRRGVSASGVDVKADVLRGKTIAEVPAEGGNVGSTKKRLRPSGTRRRTEHIHESLLEFLNENH